MQYSEYGSVGGELSTKGKNRKILSNNLVEMFVIASTTFLKV